MQTSIFPNRSSVSGRQWQILTGETALLGEDTAIASDDIEVGSFSIHFRYKLTPGSDDEDFGRRPQRRRYEEPLHVTMRKQLLGIAESVRNYHELGVAAKLTRDQPLKKTDEEISSVAKIIADNYGDEDLRNTFLDLMLQLYVILIRELYPSLIFI